METIITRKYLFITTPSNSIILGFLMGTHRQTLAYYKTFSWGKQGDLLIIKPDIVYTPRFALNLFQMETIITRKYLFITTPSNSIILGFLMGAHRQTLAYYIIRCIMINLNSWYKNIVACQAHHVLGFLPVFRRYCLVFEPTCANARWAHMHHFPSVRDNCMQCCITRTTQ